MVVESRRGYNAIRLLYLELENLSPPPREKRLNLVTLEVFVNTGVHVFLPHLSKGVKMVHLVVTWAAHTSPGR